jgi:hypothetical protein
MAKVIMGGEEMSRVPGGQILVDDRHLENGRQEGEDEEHEPHEYGVIKLAKAPE